MKKIISYSFILIILLGLFSPFAEAQAVTGGCTITNPALPAPQSTRNMTRADCQNQLNGMSTPGSTGVWTPSDGSPAVTLAVTAITPTSGTAGGAPSGSTGDAFKDAINDQACINLTHFDIGGCLVKVAYYLFFALPAFILTISAKLFNALLGLTISSTLYRSSSFIGDAWKVVRDLSNIFFIIILLYAAIEMILGIGHGAKKTIGSVVIMALLINFSMVITKVVIDSSNILALVFYERIVVSTKTGVIPDPATITGTGVPEKDISRAIAEAFNPAAVMDQKLFNQTMVVNGTDMKVGKSSSILLAIIFVSCAIFLFAAYAFFISGFSFLGRMIELWILIIFSPFAFMSYALPILSGIEGIGWKSWLQRLLAASFMAPIFMFFLYLIAKIAQTKFLDNLASGTNFLSVLLILIIPAMIILILLMKATEYAKKGSGQLGSAMIGAGKALAGLTVGGAALGTAFVARKTAGTFMKGASTGDTAANRMAGAGVRITNHQAVINNPASTVVQRVHARKEIMRERKDQIMGNIQNLGIGGLSYAGAQTWVGTRLNQDQHHIEEASHARHELDAAAAVVKPGKKWDDLNGEQRTIARRNLERDRIVRENAGNVLANGAPTIAGIATRFDNRKWKDLTIPEQTAVTAAANARIAGNTDHAGEHTIPEARVKQGSVSSVIQSAVTGTYDPRNLANIIAKEQSTGFAKITAGITGAFAKSFRAGFSTAGIKFGEKPEGKFLKDLGMTITDALKSAQINVDLSHVGEEKKEGAKGGGGGHH